MNTYQSINLAMADTFARLQRLETQEPRATLQFCMLQRAFGQQCYLAEEALEPQQLRQLKWALDLNGVEWQAYKRKALWGLDIVVVTLAEQKDDEDEALS